MKFKRVTIEIDLGNDAFQPEPNHELVRVLTRAIERIAGKPLGDLNLRDSNGNTVGKLSIEME